MGGKSDPKEFQLVKSDTLGYQGPSFVLESLWKTEPISGRRKPNKKNNPKGRKNADELGLSNNKAKGNNEGKQAERNKNRNAHKNKDNQPKSKDNVQQSKENGNRNKVSGESKTDICANVMEML